MFSINFNMNFNYLTSSSLKTTISISLKVMNIFLKVGKTVKNGPCENYHTHLR